MRNLKWTQDERYTFKTRKHNIRLDGISEASGVFQIRKMSKYENEKIWGKCQTDCTPTTRKALKPWEKQELTNINVSTGSSTKTAYHSLWKALNCSKIKNRVCVKSYIKIINKQNNKHKDILKTIILDFGQAHETCGGV